MLKQAHLADAYLSILFDGIDGACKLYKTSRRSNVKISTKQ